MVASIDGDIKLKVDMEDIPPGRLSGNEMLIRDTILDKQIVDIDDLKVVRVNDVLLAWIKGRCAWPAWTSASTASYGASASRGVPRRFLKVLKFPEHIIPWSYIDPLDPALRKVHLKIPRRNVERPPSCRHRRHHRGARQSGTAFTIFKSLDGETAAETFEEVEPDVRAIMRAAHGRGRSSRTSSRI